MSDLLDKSMQLPLVFENSNFPSSEEEVGNVGNVVRSNVIKVGFGLRNISSVPLSRETIVEQQILEDVLREAQKLKW